MAEISVSIIPTKILVPVDFSQSSHAALEVAAGFAQQIHAKLHLVHVIPTFPRTTFPDFAPETEFLAKVRKDAETHFAACKSDLATKGIKVDFCIEDGNDVAGILVDVVEREKIDMVVISTHGITGWHPMAFGSIAEKLVRLVQCPLLLLRSTRPESSVKPISGRLMEWW